MRSRDRGYQRCRNFSTHIEVICNTRSKRDWSLCVKAIHRKGIKNVFFGSIDPNVWGYGWFKKRGIG